MLALLCRWCPCWLLVVGPRSWTGRGHGKMKAKVGTLEGAATRCFFDDWHLYICLYRE
jgi:hypothetical protein